MIDHATLGDTPFTRSRRLYQLIAAGKIMLGGNQKQKIYGTLNCRSGKRLTIQNRVFFESGMDALNNNYRPCGNCMPAEHKLWKDKNGTI